MTTFGLNTLLRHDFKSLHIDIVIENSYLAEVN